MQRRLEYLPPEIDYNYDRFNTKKERETTLSIDEKFKLETDIQNIRIGHETLILLISSEINNFPFRFELVVQPFDKVLFEHEKFVNYNQKGNLILWSLGIPTKYLFASDEKLNEAYPDISSNPGGIILHIDSYQIDPDQSSILIHGQLKDLSDFKVIINYKDFRLQLLAPTDSFVKKSNFPNYNDYSSIDKSTET